MNAMNLGEEYVSLGLRLDKHISGIVDAYFGPSDLKKSIENEDVKSLQSLKDDIVELIDFSSSSSCNNPNRLFIKKQLDALKLIILQELGEKTPFEEYVQGTLDIETTLDYDDVIVTEHEKIRDLLLAMRKIKANEPLVNGIASWEESAIIPTDDLQSAIDEVVEKCRELTNNLISLPDKESVEFKLVTNAPWGEAYNWYLGKHKSKVEINTDFPRTIYDLYALVTHEAYPGHHTELSSKEDVYQKTGMVEYTIVLLNTPMNVISEGIADYAYNIIFPKESRQDWQLSRRLINLKLACLYKAAILKHVVGISNNDVKNFFIDTAFFPEKKAVAYVDFLNYPMFRGYVMSYFFGQKLIERSFSDSNTNQVRLRLKSLMRNLNYPSELVID
jgi:hypothetical protein